MFHSVFQFYSIRESIDLWIGQDCCGTTILFVECLIAFNIDNVVLLANYSTIEKFGLHIVKYSKLVMLVDLRYKIQFAS